MARADPTLKDKQGSTPVHFAASCGHANMLEQLLQYGGSGSTPDNYGFTPIHKAAYNGHDKCLETMLDVSVGGVLWVWSLSINLLSCREMATILQATILHHFTVQCKGPVFLECIIVL